MSTTKSWTHHRARVAALTRDRLPDDPELQDARRSLRFSRISDAITEAVTAAPILTAEQLDQLAVLLRSGGTDDDA